MSASSASESGKPMGCWGIAAIMLVISLIVRFWAWILGAIGVVLVAWLLVVLIEHGVTALAHRREKRARAAELQRAERAELLTRAHVQHEAFLRGDPRGIYGIYPPVDLPDLPGAG